MLLVVWNWFGIQVHITIMVADANVAQIITRFGYSLFGKAKKWFKQGKEVRPHATVADLLRKDSSSNNLT